MAIFSLLTQTFDVPETSKVFLESYVDRVRNYISRNHLDSSLLEDLLERLAEKLFDASATEDGITEKNVLDIVNSLGEPEDIFRDIVDAKKTQDTPKITKEDVKDFFKREFHRNQKEGIVLGVCAGLGDTFGINPIWIRLTFVLLTFAYGANVIIYLLLGILLPEISRKVAQSNVQTETTEKRIERQAHEMTEDLQSNTKNYMRQNSNGFFGIIGRVISSLLNIFIGFFRGIAKLVVFIVLSFISLGFLGAGLGVIIGGATVSYDFAVETIRFFAYIPSWLPWLALASGIAFIILAIMVGSRALRKPVGNSWLALVSICIIFISVFGGIRAGISIGSNYGTQHEKTLEKTSIQTQSGMVFSIDEEDMGDDFDANISDRLSDISRIEFVTSPDNTLTIETLASIRTADTASAENIFSEISPINIKIDGNTIHLSRSSRLTYKKPMPFAFLARSLRVTVPKNVSIIPHLNRHQYYRFENVRASDEMESYNLVSCRDTAIFFSPEKNIFTCHDTKQIEDRKNAHEAWKKRNKEELIESQNDDFFGENAHSPRIDRYEHIDDKTIIVTWHEEDKVGELHKLKIEFDGTNKNDEPLIAKKTPLDK